MVRARDNARHPNLVQCVGANNTPPDMRAERAYRNIAAPERCALKHPQHSSRSGLADALLELERSEAPFCEKVSGLILVFDVLEQRARSPTPLSLAT